MNGKILYAENIIKKYNNHTALNNISLEVDEGEFIGIMGTSGSGKTTLLNVLSTIDDASSGIIKINGDDILDLNENKKSEFRKDYLGFIFQDYLLLDSLTIRENISLPLSLIGVDSEYIEEGVVNISKRFSIEEQLDKYPQELSGGQKQRASAARALVKDPYIVFADEPTGALDSNSAKDLLNKLQEVNTYRKTTILMVTHDAFAASYAKRILLLKDGMIIKEIKRGTLEQKEFFNLILDEISLLEY